MLPRLGNTGNVWLWTSIECCMVFMQTFEWAASIRDTPWQSVLLDSLPVRKFSGQCVTINYNKPAVLLQCFSATLSNRLYFFPVPLFVAFEIKRCNLETSSRQIITHLQGHFFCHLCLNPSEDKPLRSAAVLSGLSGLRREVILSATIAGRRLAARQLYTYLNHTWGPPVRW